jgi:hypothetical protein
MNSPDFLFSNKAAQSFREIIQDLQQVSLLSAEKVRSRIMHKLHLIHHQPLQSSKPVDLPGLPGHFRQATALNYKIYYSVEDERICVVDILLDKSAKTI